MVLKGADGNLYHAEQLVGQLIIPISGAGVFKLNRTTNKKDRIEARLTKFDCVEILREARTFILTDDKRRDTGGWLIEIHPTSAMPPGNLTEEHKIRQTEKRKIQLVLPDSSPTTGNGAGKLTNATTHVKEMVERLEKERKQAEEKERERSGGKKENKGIFAIGRMFGK
ncbi:hypothetical protein ACGC1H_004163 [Rhizoctonia solani]